MLEFNWFRNGAWVGLTVKSDNLLLNLNSKMWFFKQLNILEFKWFRNWAWVGLAVKNDTTILNLNLKFETNKNVRI